MFRGAFGFFISYLLFSSTTATSGAAMLGGPPVVGALGFTTKGIAAKSVGALMMKAAALFNRGSVPTGSLVSKLQSLGAKAGLSTLGPIGARTGYDFHKYFVCGKSKKSSSKN
ncbi:interferon alpha-inducible protein 6-like [Rhincodon typus]|uniref:interferon alpha-inducible protein 6-like n=1 Tax=Rhincodon typus TaxID=259920 RepID=UPI00202F2938|nr:interferon alpha-inducible protein 6-like [Rhincodon typus]XP_048468845.1 interferon alpha-inducible protein 6-like [Rhincodon typus]XP_048468846.1 interferon alpha-inducible protein 6-like [Rhincodon typus]